MSGESIYCNRKDKMQYAELEIQKKGKKWKYEELDKRKM
jgi:hypothetical protein